MSEVKVATGPTSMTTRDTGIGVLTERKDGNMVRARIFQSPRGISMFVYDKAFKLDGAERYADFTTALKKMMALSCL